MSTALKKEPAISNSCAGKIGEEFEQLHLIKGQRVKNELLKRLDRLISGYVG